MTILTLSDNHRHILLVPMAAWGERTIPAPTSRFTEFILGHAKPLCSLASRIVRARPETVTLLTPGVLFPRMEKELARLFDDNEIEYRGRIRCASLLLLLRHSNDPGVA